MRQHEKDLPHKHMNKPRGYFLINMVQTNGAHGGALRSVAKEAKPPERNEVKAEYDREDAALPHPNHV